MDDTDPAGDEAAGDEAADEPAQHRTAPPETEADFRALAEDWIAIWQSEITAYLTDPETQEAWGAMIAVWTGAAQAMMRAMPPAPGFGMAGAPPDRRPERRPGRRPRAAAAARDADGHATATQSPGSDAAPGAAPLAAAPVARDDEVRRLEQRVAELERHLADQDRRSGAAGDHRRTRRTSRPRG